MKMKNLFKTAIFAGAAISAASLCASNLSADAAFDWQSAYPNAQLDDEHSLLDGSVRYDYGNCNFLRSLKPGDIYFEADGSSGIEGHIAIIEGVYYNTTYRQVYIRTIEAPGNGSKVQRKVLDMYRYAHNKDNRIVRVKSRYIYSNTINNALAFCERQIGSWYPSDAELLRATYEGPHVLGQWLYLPAKYWEPDYEPGIYCTWYCSELIYAAYYTATGGVVNLNPGDNFNHPKEIRDSEYVDTLDTNQYYHYYHDYDDRYYNLCDYNFTQHEVRFDGYKVGYDFCNTITLPDGTKRCLDCGHYWYKPGC